MKKILCILLCLPLIFNSCKKEDNSSNSGTNNGGNNTSGSIIGTWKIVTFTFNRVYGYIDPVFLTEVETGTDTQSGPPNGEDEYWTFRDDETMSFYLYHDTLSYYIHSYYEKNGNDLSIHYFNVMNMSGTVTLLTNNNFNFECEVEGQNTFYDTTFFQKDSYSWISVKSELPSITTEPLNKKKPVNGYNSFLNRRN